MSTSNRADTQNGRTAVLVAYPDPLMIEEAKGLAEAAGYRVLETITQRYLSKAKYGLGSGKAETLRQRVEELSADVVLFDERLRSVQIYNLAEITGREVIDREKLILEIFSKRATTAEAKLQVHLAELAYEMPRAKAKVRLAKRGEQPGFFGLGKYDVDVYDRDIKRRMSVLKEKLEDASKRRELYRIQRRRLDMSVVSLAGYTGVGKTTLFNSLTGESKEVKDSLFTTLTTATRSVEIQGFRVLISDTVGFISRLPTYMIEAFKSTLEELTYANLVILLVDAAQPIEEVARKYQSSVEILAGLNVSPSRVLLVFNKADMIDGSKIEERVSALRATGQSSVAISAKTGLGLDELKSKIFAAVSEYSEAEIPVKQPEAVRLSKHIDLLKKQGAVEIAKHIGGDITIYVKAPNWVIDRLKRALEDLRLGRYE